MNELFDKMFWNTSVTITPWNKHSMTSRVLNTLFTSFATVKKLSQDKIVIFESFKLHDFVIT